MIPVSFFARIAFRYLRPSRSRPKSRLIWLWPALFLLAFLFLQGVHWVMHQPMVLGPTLSFWEKVSQAIVNLFLNHPEWRSLLKDIKFCVGVFAVVVFVLVVLIRNFNMFTTISVFGLFLGSASLVCSLSFMSAFGSDIKKNILGISAELEVAPVDDLRSFDEYPEVLKKAKQVQGILAGSPVLTMSMAMVNTRNDQVAMVVAKGIDPDQNRLVSKLEKSIEEGRFDQLKPHPESGEQQPGEAPSLQKRGILIGRELAAQLNVFVGDDIQLVSAQLGNGPQRFWVVGIFFTGHLDYDKEYVFVHLPDLQRVLGMENDISALQFKIQREDQVDSVQLQLAKSLGMGPDGKGYQVRSWKQIHQTFFSSLEFERIAMFFGLGLIVLVAAFSIASNGLMLVSEKRKEIAILKSMGATNGGVQMLFTLLGLFVGGLGVSLGITMGILSCKLMEYFGIPFLDSSVFYVTQVAIPVHAKEIVLIVFSTMLVSLVATLYPAWLASRLRIVSTLR